MTKSDPAKAPGYRRSLPSRDDRMAKPWILTVIGAFVLVLALSALGVPSRFTPDPTPIPLPSVPVPSGSAGASGSVGSPSPDASESAAPSPSD
jgi:hypothetical protein